MRYIYNYLQSTKVLGSNIMQNIKRTKSECALRNLELNRRPKVSMNSMPEEMKGTLTKRKGDKGK